MVKSRCELRGSKLGRYRCFQSKPVDCVVFLNNTGYYVHLIYVE